MITLILLLFLCFGFFMGLRRGFVMQTVHLFGFIVSFVVAALLFRKLADQLSFWVPYPELAEGSEWALFLSSDPLESAFYNAVSFAIIFFSVKIILQIIASMLHVVVQLPGLKFVNKWVGGVLGLIEVYFISFIILYILALTPIAGLQERIDKSILATLMIEYTPIVSGIAKSLWFTEILSLMNV